MIIFDKIFDVYDFIENKTNQSMSILNSENKKTWQY